MTITMDRSIVTAGDETNHGVRSSRPSAHAAALSPRLAQGRPEPRQAAPAPLQRIATAGTIHSSRPDRTRLRGGRGELLGAGSRSAARVGRRPVRGASRPAVCARRTPPSLQLCLAIGAGALLVFFALISLAGLAGSGAVGAGAAAAGTPALTSLVTVREGQTLAQVCAQIAPERPVAEVSAALTEINGLRGGAVHAGQTLITPRY